MPRRSPKSRQAPGQGDLLCRPGKNPGAATTPSTQPGPATGKAGSPEGTPSAATPGATARSAATRRRPGSLPLLMDGPSSPWARRGRICAAAGHPHAPSSPAAPRPPVARPGGRTTPNPQGLRGLRLPPCALGAGRLGDELPSSGLSPTPPCWRGAPIAICDILMAHLGIWSRQDPFAPCSTPAPGARVLFLHACRPTCWSLSPTCW